MTSSHATLLVEIGTEELPPLALRRLSEAFGAEIGANLHNARIEHGQISCFATPRRLAVSATQVQTRQAEEERTRRGPSLRTAFDNDGNPTKAALGFARSCGVDVGEIERLTTEEGCWLVSRKIEKGHPTISLLPTIVFNALSRLPIPKRMRWSDKEVEFVRPVRWVVLLLGGDVVEAEIMGITSGRMTRGHRFHHPEPLVIRDTDDYAQLLRREGNVVADFHTRREMIRHQVEEAARRIRVTGGDGTESFGRALITDALLEEVASLVEWPTPIVGAFDPKFLELPAKVLTGTMTGHQKYFPVVDPQGNPMPNFITVSNVQSRNPDVVRRGNERVIHPRLADAAFFFEADLRRPLAERLTELESVVFQKRLGSLLDKSRRVSRLAGWVADALEDSALENGASETLSKDLQSREVTLAHRAGLLCKCDLMTQMVGELPELQGYMGRIYAEKTGEEKATAIALEEVYQPRFAGDQIPATRIGRIVAIADRLDTLVGIFGIGQIPKGDRDPFALRRAALGVLRILMEGRLNLSLPSLVHAAVEGYGELLDPKETTPKVLDFITERLRGYFAEQGFESDIFAAVVACAPERPLDFVRRMHAVAAFRKLPEAASLASSNKRIRNILKQASPEGEFPSEKVDDTLLREDAERRLAAHVADLTPHVTELLAKRNYAEAMVRLAALKDSVDAFFDAVLVMTEDEKIKKNRLALLRSIHILFSEIADISRLHQS
uniref:Glycine--tRNA ligase beta subunit n=1 Tax=Candidatus Kentrum sp. TC TaxID=2126339 RepID=A0A450Z2Y4_9GAMM|nr:MAG: glycyl-tRNA synthetase beta chain [Candidatus Kentron sp. TC]